MAPYNHVKLDELAHTQNITPPLPLTRLSQLTTQDVPNFVTDISEVRAEDCLQEYLQQSKSSKSISRRLTLRTRSKSDFEIRDIIAVLPGLIDNNEDAGVVQVLLNREQQILQSTNADKIQSRLGDCAALLLKAAEASNTNLVWLLAPRTSLPGKNAALAAALATRTSSTIKKLLQYNADPNHCSERFRAAAAARDQFIIDHLLIAPVQLEQKVLIDALVSAVHSQELRILQRIVHATDFEGLQEVEAVGEAARGGQVDVLLTILLSANCIHPDYLDGLVLEVFTNPTIDSACLTKILHALFYAGAGGPKSSAAMRLAVEKYPNFVPLFAEHRVDINWGSGIIVRAAVGTGRSDLLRIVLTSGSVSSDNASAAVRALPQNLPADDRLELLEILTDAGAHGEPVEKELILAVRNNDRRVVNLLRRNRVSIDTHRGDALIAAIQNQNVDLLTDLLNGPVAQYSLQSALPHVRYAGKTARLVLTRLLVEAKVEGEAVDTALRDAVCDDSLDHDPELIQVLIQAGGSPMYHDAQSVRHAILHEDAGLFEVLLRSPAGVSQGVISSLIPDVLSVRDRTARLSMMSCSLATRPKETSVAAALLTVVEEDRVDMRLLELITRSGQADINYRDGIILEKGALTEMRVLQELVRINDRSRATTTTALVKLLGNKPYDDEAKATRAKILLSSGRTPLSATEGLRCYVEFLIKSGLTGEDWPLQTFKVLLDAGADINSCVTVLPDVTKAAAVRLLRTLLKQKPHVALLDSALSEAVILDRRSRADVVQMILEAGPSKNSISSALVQASHANFDDTCSMLLTYDPSIGFDNFAAIRHAAMSGNMKLLQVFLDYKPSQEAIDATFDEAKSITDARQRFHVMQAILKVGVQRKVLSEYLIDQVGCRSQQDMIQMLLDHQADVQYLQNRSLVLATLEGDLDIVRMLFTKATDRLSAATQCFDDLVRKDQVTQDRVPILSFLLDAGARGNSLNIALRQAIHNLPSQPGLLHLLDVLLSHGADINHDQGYVLCHACRYTRSEAVAILVKWGPSVNVRSRAMHYLLESNVSESEFCRILDLLMTTGTSTQGTAEFFPTHEEFEKPLKVLLSRRPNGVVELTRVLDHQPRILSQTTNKSILAWAMRHPHVLIDDQCLALLISRGANVNYRDSKNGESILLQAIKHRRSKLVKLMLTHDADITISDNNGTSPLLLASQLGDHLAVSNLLEMGAPKNDGSLHHAVCGLKIQVVEVLLKHGHDPNYPCLKSHGRNALAELLYTGKASPQNHKTVERVIHLLREYGANTRRLVSRKPLICWALDNKHEPVHMVQALLAAYLYKEIDEDFNFYSSEGFVFSPTMYVAKRQFTGNQDQANELIQLLRNWGANRDVYYSTLGPQPEDAQGMPEELLKIEMVRRAKVAMRREEEEDIARRRRLDDEEFEREKQREEQRFQRTLRNRQYMQLEDARMQKEQNALAITLGTEREDARQRDMYKAHKLQITMSNEMAENEQKMLSNRLRIQQGERENELRHRTALSEMELQTTKERLTIEGESQRTRAIAAQSALEKEIEGQKKLLSTRDHFDERMYTRRMKQLTMEKAVPVGIARSPVGGGFIENGP